MKTIKSTVSIMGVALCASSLTSQAATIVAYNFDNAGDANGSDDALPAVFVASSTASNVTASSFDHGAGFTSLTAVGVPDPDYMQIAEGNGMADGTGDDMAGAITANEYVFFTVSAAAGFSLDLNQLTFDAYRAGNGTNDYSVRSSVDSYASDLTGNVAGYANGALNTTRSAQTISLTDPSFDNLTGTVEFRIYFDDRQSNTGNGSATIVDDFLLDGTVIPIPEPSSTALLGLGGLALILRRRK